MIIFTVKLVWKLHGSHKSTSNTEYVTKFQVVFCEVFCECPSLLTTFCITSLLQTILPVNSWVHQIQTHAAADTDANKTRMMRCSWRKHEVHNLTTFLLNCNKYLKTTFSAFSSLTLEFVPTLFPASFPLPSSFSSSLCVVLTRHSALFHVWCQQNNTD